MVRDMYVETQAALVALAVVLMLDKAVRAGLAVLTETQVAQEAQV
jgi:hypothetical protein